MPGNAIVNYVNECREELRKVVWPSREKIVRDTLIVILLSGGLAAFIGVADYGLTKIFERVIGI